MAALVCPVILGSAALAQTAAPAPNTKPTPTSATAKTPPRPYFPPIRGTAAIGFLKPVVKVNRKTNEVVTTFKVKNLSALGAIASLRCEGFWYDKQGNLLPGGVKTQQLPLNPGEVVTMEVRTRWLPTMYSDQYRFTHANGQIQAKLLATLN
jgi:hypothetical protein